MTCVCCASKEREMGVTNRVPEQLGPEEPAAGQRDTPEEDEPRRLQAAAGDGGYEWTERQQANDEPQLADGRTHAPPVRVEGAGTTGVQSLPDVHRVARIQLTARSADKSPSSSASNEPASTAPAAARQAVTARMTKAQARTVEKQQQKQLFTSADRAGARATLRRCEENGVTTSPKDEHFIATLLQQLHHPPGLVVDSAGRVIMGALRCLDDLRVNTAVLEEALGSTSAAGGVMVDELRTSHEIMSAMTNH